MTHITIERGAGRWRFAADGHAAGAPEACAGVSALLYALAAWLRDDPAGVRTEDVCLAPGEAEIAFAGGLAAETAADLTAAGLKQIAGRYPGAVAVAEAED